MQLEELAIKARDASRQEFEVVPNSNFVLNLLYIVCTKSNFNGTPGITTVTEL